MKHLKSLFGRDTFLRVTLPVLLVIALALIAVFSFQKPGGLGEDEAKTKAEAFINDYLMQSGTKATIKEITEEYDLYKMKIDIVSDVVESYMSKDGKLFFPQALNMEEIASGGGATAANGSGAAPATTVSVKSDKPQIELFVMSHCPYGTQIEKGILPVLKTLGSKIDFKLKFVDYAMHGEKELKEQINQYCIQKNQPDKLQAYLECFLKAGDDASCVTSTGIDKNKLSSCYSQTDEEYSILANFNSQTGYKGSFPGFGIYAADNQKYGVAGSPTLVINGQEISSGRDAASLLNTICSAFNNAPSECETVLPSEQPAPGFGTGTVAAADTAAACAPAQ